MSAKTQISSPHWDSIVRGIDSGLCVPFLGAGVNYGTLPMGSDVARALLGKLLGAEVGTFAELIDVKPTAALVDYPDLGRARVEDLARVALHLELEVNHPGVVGYLKEIIVDDKCEPGQLLRVLARVPFTLIVTTNYDRLLEAAFDLEQQPKPLVLSQPIGGFEPAEAREWRAKLAGDSRIVYKLHGSFDDETPNLVVSEDDYIEFLGIAANDKLGVPKQIKATITDSVLLFLGYGLEDWDVRTIYKLLIEKTPTRTRNRSFAIQKDPTPFWVGFWARKDVTIYNIDLAEFAGQLEHEYAKRSRVRANA